jgi:hypothetical protein
MRHSRQLAIGLFAAVALAAVALTGGARAQDGAPPKVLKIAVLNMGDCIEAGRNDQAKDLEAKFNTINREDPGGDGQDPQEGGRAEGPGQDHRGVGPARISTCGRPRSEPRGGALQDRHRDEDAPARMASESFRSQLYVDARKMVTLMAQE